MKKGFKIAFLGAIAATMCGFGLFHMNASPVLAEQEPEILDTAPVEDEPVYTSQVSFEDWRSNNMFAQHRPKRWSL